MGAAAHVGSFAVNTAVIRGVEAIPVTVEVSCSPGIPGYSLVGMADPIVMEARSRVRCAISACGFDNPRLHITINLAPAELRKTGTGFDLPIAVAILAASGQIPTAALEGCLFVGELALDGQVCPVRGSFAYALLAERTGLELVSSPEGLPDGGVSCASRALPYLGRLRQGMESLPAPTSGSAGERSSSPARRPDIDYADVCDQEVAKRAMVIAATGRHGLLMVGPPGAGKTMLARRLPTILPPLGEAERVESVLVHSVAGQPIDDVAGGMPPFRAPHHSVSLAGLVGGGKPVMPGEISMAHKGVLFLDELPEFASNVLQALRQPLEDRAVRLVRAEGRYRFPCDFMLVAAANPCPCGHLGDPGHPCTCAPARVESYQARMGGPLADRIDMRVDVARPASRKVIAGSSGLSSAQMAKMVGAGREFAALRQGGGSSDGPTGTFDRDALVAFEAMAGRLLMGGRSIARAARVARTIADIEHHDLVTRDDIVEACSYRGRSHG